MESKVNIKSKAIFVEKKERNFEISFKENIIKTISEEEVIVKVHYSSINYKDVLLCNGDPGLVRKYPHIPGIDLAGEVYLSKSKKFKVGQLVIVVAQPLGVEIQGGFSEFVKMPSNYLEEVPFGITMKEAMIFGTAGFTAALAIYKFEKNIENNNRKILVTGATGGVGLISTYFLYNKGYEIYAVTSKKEYINFLKSLGVADIVKVEETKFPLLKQKYSGIIDARGGGDISNYIGQLLNDGIITVIGMISSNKIDLSLLPFIIRGINMFGINAESATPNLRKIIWKNILKMKTKLIPKNLYRECSLYEVKKEIEKLKNNQNVGRILVRVISK